MWDIGEGCKIGGHPSGRSLLEEVAHEGVHAFRDVYTYAPLDPDMGLTRGKKALYKPKRTQSP